jgi:hypothetical protein
LGLNFSGCAKGRKNEDERMVLEMNEAKVRMSAGKGMRKEKGPTNSIYLLFRGVLSPKMARSSFCRWGLASQ